MSQLKLNLGQFDRCVDYSSERKNRPVDPGTKIFYCEHPNADKGECVVLNELDDQKRTELLSNGFFEIPTFVIGKNNKYGVDHLLSLVELDILSKVKETIEKSDGHAKFEDIVIQIKSLQVFEDNAVGNGRYVLVEFGIAVIVPAVECVIQ